MKFGLNKDIIELIAGVFAKYPQIEKALIYGSRAKGNFKKGSDIDITLKGEGINLSIINSLLIEIDDLFLPYTFDLSVYSHIKNVDLIEHIERVGKVFYERQLNSDE